MVRCQVTPWMRTLPTAWRAVPLALLLVACNSAAPVAYCTAAPSRALWVSIRDSLSEAAVADSTTGVAATTTYQDSLHHVSDSTAWAGDQLGTYTLTIHRPGYAEWTRADIVVSQLGQCGTVTPVQVPVRLVPVP